MTAVWDVATAGNVALQRAKVRAMLLKEYRGDPCTINPRRSRWMPAWDVTMFLATLFAAIVTPFEVGFVKDAHCDSALFTMNRIVDLAFLLDMLLLFHLQFPDPHSGMWVTSRWKIAVNYLKGWFWIDLLSVLPMYLVPLLQDDPTCYPYVRGGSRYANGTSSDPTGISKAAQGVRTIRLLRLLKLARMLKAARVFNRLITDAVVTYFEITYAVLEMMKLVFLILFIAHLQACMWGFLPSLFVESGDTHTWEHALRVAKGVDHLGAAELYVASMYWSIMTLTGIGYGDIYPQNTVEQVLCSVLMLVSASAWAYVIGTVAGIYSTLNPNLIQYRNTMDALNYFMRDRRLPKEMRIMLREYFTNARPVHESTDDEELLSKMSPLLQGTVAVAANREWLAQIWFLNGLGTTRLEKDFIAALAMRLGLSAFVMHERLPIGQMYVLRRGMVVKLYRFLGKGRVWGEDSLLEARHFEIVDHSQAVALTFVETYMLRRCDFVSVANSFPRQMEVVGSRMRKIILQRYLLLYLSKHFKGSFARSFVCRSQADGYA